MLPDVCESWRRHRHHRSYGNCNLWGIYRILKINPEYTELLRVQNPETDFAEYINILEKGKGVVGMRTLVVGAAIVDLMMKIDRLPKRGKIFHAGRQRL